MSQISFMFVGDVQYVYDLDDAGEQSEYPKYPIEMLWEQGGDCEDASALYISLVEALGYDAAFDARVDQIKF